MKTAIKTLGIIDIVIGSLAFLGSFDGSSGAIYAFLGGLFYIAQGVLMLVFINKCK
jgi:hypothetical protein